MIHPRTLWATFGTAAAALGACTPSAEVPQDAGAPVYAGASVVILDDGLVSLNVALAGAKDETAIEAYARCAAAQYALDQGFGFARQVRTIVKKERQMWYGDAVYLLSSALPEGLRTIDAEVTVTECEELGIPTV
jgi:hypothetical protein